MIHDTKLENVLTYGQVAILLATYNGVRYLEEQLDSLRRQTWKNFICFIHDDGSDDGTQEIANRYCENYPDHFVYLGCSKTGGAKYNFMYLLKNVEADYIMFCDQDDVWMPEKIEKMYLKMREVENNETSCPTCVFSDLTVTDENLKIMSESFYAYSKINPERLKVTDLLYRNVAPGCTMMVNRSLQKIALAADVTELIDMHDRFMILIAASFGKLDRMREPLMYYRQHSNNVIGAHKKNIWQKFKRTFAFNKWLNEKRRFFMTTENSAKAVLTCLEAYEEMNVAEDKKIQTNIRILKKFIKKQSDPLLVKLIRFYRWDFGGN